MSNFSINSNNCFNLFVDDNIITYSRLLDNHLYRVTKDCSNIDILGAIQIIANLSNEDFKFIASLSKE